MPIPLLLTGLSLLPKIPSIWGAIAGLFGKKVPDSVEAAGKLAGDVMNSFKAGEISPEVQLEMEKIMNDHKEEMAKITLEEHRLVAEGFAGVQQVEIESYKSDDQYVRRTRPMLLRKLFYTCMGYVFFAPVVVIVASISVLGIKAAMLTAVIGIVKWIGGWLFSTFAAAYLGYTGARSLDKKDPSIKNKDNLVGTAMKYILK